MTTELIHMIKSLTARINAATVENYLKFGFDPAQPRDENGQWVDTGRGYANGGNGNSDRGRNNNGRNGESRIFTGPRNRAHRIRRTVQYLDANARPKSISRCATYVRRAIKYGGQIEVEIPAIRPGKKLAQARDYDPSLEKAGFEQTSSSMQPATPPDPKKLEKGDVAVIQQTTEREDGHMAMYNGKQWVSDFKQNYFWPGSSYAKERPSYVIYRLPKDQ